MEACCHGQGHADRRVPLDHKGDPDRKTFLRDSLDYATLFERMGFRLASQEIRDASALPVTSADERPAFFFATRKAS